MRAPAPSRGMIHVTAVVAPNGMGHLVRCLEVLGALRATAGTRTTLVTTDTAARRAGGIGAIRARLGEDANVVAAFDGLEPLWSSDARRFEDGSLDALEQRIAGTDAIAGADVVISDNLGATLAVRPDAVMMGSFLWADVLGAAHPGNPAVAEFVERERELLAATRPPMICVRDVAMPGVRSRTDAVAVGWMCPPAAHPVRSGDTVVVAGGWTGAADDLLAASATVVEQAGREVRRAAADGEVGRGPFAGVEAASVAVCRPGIGSVTSCIAAGVPMVLVREGGNAELDHNAQRLAELGVALDAGAGPDPAEVARLVDEASAPDRSAAMRARIAGLRTDGIAEAARWLAARIAAVLEKT